MAFPGAGVDLPVWGEAFLVVTAVLSIVFALVRLLRNRRRDRRR
ncbi:hypothetical protein [Streptomyces griseoloalbus]|uniref:Uncharacterized protein n=1 Tax=Streptomyces griseoloalbus TaxID=67303 RepID=A0A7W8BKQ2_9ACTN|nr:hypothetical protein [Streptomyces albaduncus]MBB5124136.1 hypothetical protein [Streptomyces albaduncus]